MRFALLGQGPVSLSLVAAIASRPRHTLSHAVMAEESLAAVLKLAPGVQATTDWDELLADAGLDAVIVDGQEPSLLEAAKQFAHAGKSLLVVPQAVQGSTWIYELTLIRDATGALLFPVLPRRWLPEIVRLRAVLQSGTAGQLRFLQLDREQLPGVGGQMPALLSTAVIDEEMLADVDVLRSLGVDFNRVTALYSGRTGNAVSMATMTLGSEHPPEAVWTIKAASSAPTWKLTATGEKGALRLVGSSPEDGRLEAEGIGLPASAVEPAQEAAATVLDGYEALGSGRQVRPDWDDLTRAFEIVESAHESARRRRTIDLHFESTSERGVFKSQMAALGCGVLALTLAGVVFLLIVGRLLDVRDATQVAAERAGSVICRDVFLPQTADLTDDAKEHLAAIAERSEMYDFPVLVEQTDDSATSPLDEQRRQTVVRFLKAAGVTNADRRVQLGAVKGTWLVPVLRLVRILIFLPLFLFLIFQLLLFLARPSSGRSQSASASNGL